MNGLIKKIFLSFFLFLSFSAFGSEVQGGDTSPTVVDDAGVQVEKHISNGGEVLRDDDYYEMRRILDADRRGILDRSRARYSGPTCEDVDDSLHVCVDMCRDIYARRSDRAECEKLPIRQIEVMVETHRLLEKPDDLWKIDLPDLEVYFNVSIAAFHRLVGRYNKREAREVLRWIAEDQEVAELIADEDQEFVLTKALFKKITGKDDTQKLDIHEPFVTRIEGRDKLMEVVIEEANELALEWFHEYIFATAEACLENEVSSGCFRIFCEIGKGIDAYSREDWLTFEDFYDYIDDIILDGINKNNWKNGSNIQAVDDLVGDFYEELCGNLAVTEV